VEAHDPARERLDQLAELVPVSRPHLQEREDQELGAPLLQLSFSHRWDYNICFSNCKGPGKTGRISQFALARMPPSPRGCGMVVVGSVSRADPATYGPAKGVSAALGSAGRAANEADWRGRSQVSVPRAPHAPRKCAQSRNARAGTPAAKA